MSEKLKRAVIKEELVVLTGGFVEALILNQMLYWCQRAKDFDRFLNEEQCRLKTEDKEINISPTGGWIYKKAEELSDELMLGMSKQTIRRYLANLIDAGYIQERTNPDHRWDRTIQYRVNLVKIQTDLQKLGYALEGYPLLRLNAEPENTHDGANSKMELRNSKMELRDSNLEFRDSELEPQSLKNGTAIPEITTEITTEKDTQQQQSNNIYNIYSQEKTSSEQNNVVVVDPRPGEQSDKVKEIRDFCRQESLDLFILLTEDAGYMAELLRMAGVDTGVIRDALLASWQYYQKNDVPNLKGLVRQAVADRRKPSPKTKPKRGRQKDKFKMLYV